MKKFKLALLILVISGFPVFAQENESPDADHFLIGLYYAGFGENDIFRSDELDGAPSFNGKNYFSLGINSVLALNRWLNFESGVGFVRHRYTVTPNLPPTYDNETKEYSLSILEIPVTLRATILRYGFVNGGMLVDMDLSGSGEVDSQTGLGWVMGLGLQYTFKKGIMVYVNPYAKTHAFVPFTAEKYPQKVWESGFRLGVMYAL